MQIIGITGGKGGTGKSTIATSLSYELSKKYKVLLVDADVDCPNDHLLLGIKRTLLQRVFQRIPRWDFKKCNKCGLCGTVCKTKAIVSIKEKYPIFNKELCNGCGACLLKCPQKAISWDKKEVGRIYAGERYGISLLSGELKTNEPVSEVVVNSLNKMVKQQKMYDYVIVDTSAGIHCPVVSALEICNQVFAVTEPTPLGAHDLRLILQLAKEINVTTKIIVNRSNIGDERTIKLLAKEFDTSIIVRLPYSKDIALKYSNGKPIQDKNITKIIDYIR